MRRTARGYRKPRPAVAKPARLWTVYASDERISRHRTRESAERGLKAAEARYSDVSLWETTAGEEEVPHG